jgi:hypothetical protein
MMIMGNPKKVASMIIAKKLSGAGEDRAAQLRGESLEALESMNGEQDEGKIALQEAAGKLLAAAEGKSPELLAKAFQQMFRIVEMMPHEEYHEEIEEAVEGPEYGG